jgi:hypothetical protein
MRGNSSKNASRVKTYGRILKGQKKRVRQKNGGRKMKVAHFAQRRGGWGRLMFLPRIFLTFGVREGDREVAR